MTAARLPTVGGDTDAWGTILNDYLSEGAIHNMIRDFDLHPSETASNNFAGAQAAFDAAAADGLPVYLPGALAAYPITHVPNLPNTPIHFFGDGPTRSCFGITNTSGWALTYDPNTVPVNVGFGTADPVWVIHDLGFEQSFSGTIGGWFFPAWTVNPKINLWAERIELRYFPGTALDVSAFSGMAPDVHLDGFLVSQGGIGYELGSDARYYDLVAHDMQMEGFYWADGKNSQLIGGKAWNCGKATTAGRTAGLKLNNAGGITIDNFYAQDCWGPAIYAHSSEGFQIKNLVADRCNWHDGNSAVVIDGTSHNYRITGKHIKSDATGTDHTLYVASAGKNSEIDMIHDTEGSGTLLDPVDPSSNLDGVHVEINGSAGGTIPITPSAGAITPDGYQARTQYVSMGANITTVNVPTYSHDGQVMEFLFVLTGAFSVTGWNSAYKGTSGIPSSAGSNGQFMLVQFQKRGSSWYLQNAPAWRS